MIEPKQPRQSRQYRCEGCGRIFKAQGIGPHQRSRNHSGKTPVGETLPAVRPLAPAVQNNVLPPQMAAPDLALRQLPFTLYEDEKGKRYIVLEVSDDLFKETWS